MMPVRYDIKIKHGAPFGFRFRLLDNTGAVVDLTDYAVEIQFRRDFETEEILFEMSKTNGRIVSEADGWNAVSGTKEDSESLPIVRTIVPSTTRFVYDAKASKDADVLFPLSGSVLVAWEITR